MIAGMGQLDSLHADLVRAWVLAGYLPMPARDLLRETLASLRLALAELARLGGMPGDRTIH